MRRGLATLGTATWFAGLRRSQAASRAALNPLEVRDGRFKVHPIFDWSDRDVYLYLKAHCAAVPPAVGQGICVHRRLAFHQGAARGGFGG